MKVDDTVINLYIHKYFLTESILNSLTRAEDIRMIMPLVRAVTPNSISSAKGIYMDYMSSKKLFFDIVMKYTDIPCYPLLSPGDRSNGQDSQSPNYIQRPKF